MSESVPKHTTESRDDRRKQRELAEARQAGTAAPAIDVTSGQMINPHNPEFITKKPWYLGGDSTGPTLDHQAAGEKERELTLSTADNVVRQERDALKKKMKKINKSGMGFEVGMWVEALKKGKRPYLMAKVTRVGKKGNEVDLEFEDGGKEKGVRTSNGRVKATKVGSRAATSSGAHGKLTYASKRDAYHGYDVGEEHNKTIEKFNNREAIRRKLREEALAKARLEKGEAKANGEEGSEDSDSDSDADSDDSENEFVEKEGKGFTTRLARQGGVGGAQMMVTARNLRIREDTAKYLRNLDPNSAYYDPKSRSMRDNPNPEVNPEDLQFAGDNFTRITGDAVDLADTQLFAWDAQGQGINEMHAQANPSQAELLKKKYKKETETLKVTKKMAVLDKYGGGEYLDGGDGMGGGGGLEGTGVKTSGETVAERNLRFGVSTEQKEYSRDGRVKKEDGKPVPMPKSKYEEDVYVNGHTTVWGSYFHKGAFKWGYGDDHSLLRSSYYTGMNGRKANDEANGMRFGTGGAGTAALEQQRAMLKAKPKNGDVTNKHVRKKQSDLYGDGTAGSTLDEKKLKEAIKKQKEFEKKGDTGGEEEKDDRKRKYNSMASVEVTAEEMEAYRMAKKRDEGGDLLDKIADTEELLEYK